MSTRSLVGGLTDMGTYVVYVHFDGYPEGRLPELEGMVKRDGAARVLVELLSAKEGGWSVLDHQADASMRNSLGDRGRVVEGYGLAYTDAPGSGPQRFPEDYTDDVWAEWVYLIPEVGPIRYAECVHGKPPEDWDWNEHPV
jgi:hypothetical protein